VERAYGDPDVRRVLRELFALTQVPVLEGETGQAVDGTGMPTSQKANYESAGRTGRTSYRVEGPREGQRPRHARREEGGAPAVKSLTAAVRALPAVLAAVLGFLVQVADASEGPTVDGPPTCRASPHVAEGGMRR
jgi:hypothetical protein